MVHTAVAEKKDPRKVIDRYLMAYRAAPHKTTSLSPYKMIFGRKMKTKLPQHREKKKGSDREEEARTRHDLKKSQRKEAFDRRQKAKEKKLNQGDKVLIQQTKTSVKSPWDPEVEVKEVKAELLPAPEIREFSRIRSFSGNSTENSTENSVLFQNWSKTPQKASK